jgi:RNA polymerase sigma-70 factor (ECF subfamily)
MSSDMTITAGEGSVETACAEFVMDEEAFRAFYERTARGVWAYLARVSGDPHLADDLLQETFYRFLRANAAHDTEEHRRNSVYRIATNLARDARRRTFTRPESALEGRQIEGAPSGDGSGRADRRVDLSRAMSHLRPRERAMLWLAYAEGASHNEIAAVLDLSPTSLKTMLFRARRKLAALLGSTDGGAR